MRAYQKNKKTVFMKGLLITQSMNIFRKEEKLYEYKCVSYIFNLNITNTKFSFLFFSSRKIIHLQMLKIRKITNEKHHITRMCLTQCHNAYTFHKQHLLHQQQFSFNFHCLFLKNNKELCAL